MRLGDLGHVVDSVQDTKAAAWFNTTRGIVLAVLRQPGTNTVEVAAAVRAEMARLTAQLPASVKVTTIYDNSQSIQNSVADVKFTLYLTLGLVVLVIFLFLRNVSATIIPSLALPMSLVGTFAVMYVLGYSLDNLSLMALTLSVGFVVDDAVVMLENIVRHTEMGESPRDAAYKGSAEIGFTIMSMTLSLVAVFIPVLFLGGLIGRLFHEFAVTIGAAILVSGFVSLTLTPMLCSRFLRVSHEKKGEAPHGFFGRLFAVTEGIYDRTLHAYDRSLQWVMAHSRLTFAFLWRNPRRHRPARARGAEGIHSFRRSGAVARHDRNRRGHVVRRDVPAPTPGDECHREGFQRGGVHVVDGRRGSGATTNQGRFILRLADRKDRKLDADGVARELTAKLAQVPGLRTYVTNPPVINIGGRAAKSLYQYTLQGADIDQLYQAAQTMQAKLTDLKQLRDVTSDLQIKNPEVKVSMDRERASSMGVTMEQVQNALYNAYGARQVSTIYTDNNQYLGTDGAVAAIPEGPQRDVADLDSGIRTTSSFRSPRWRT